MTYFGPNRPLVDGYFSPIGRLLSREIRSNHFESFLTIFLTSPLKYANNAQNKHSGFLSNNRGAPVRRERRTKMDPSDILLCAASIAIGALGGHLYNRLRLRKLGLSREKLNILIKTFRASGKWESEHSTRFKLPRYPRRHDK
jgi:hypothetical protein